MKNKAIIKNFKNVERKIRGNLFTRPIFNRDISLIIPDTSAIIDVQTMCRSYTGPENIYQRPEFFLESLEEENKKILIPEFLMEEINNHKPIKINCHNPEISSGFFDYLCRIYESSRVLFPQFRYGADSEQVGMDVYWASKFACNRNMKKQEEHFSDVDKKLLKISFLLGTGRLEHEDSRKERNIGLVHLLSSDEHLIQGTKFLMESAGYSKVNCVNVRE